MKKQLVPHKKLDFQTPGNESLKLPMVSWGFLPSFSITHEEKVISYATTFHNIYAI